MAYMDIYIHNKKLILRKDCYGSGTVGLKLESLGQYPGRLQPGLPLIPVRSLSWKGHQKEKQGKGIFITKLTGYSHRR